MLLGEHAVVYNRPCIVAAVGQRLSATLEPMADMRLELNAEDVKVIGYKKSLKELGIGEIPRSASFAEIAVRNFDQKYPLKSGVKITTKSEFSSLFGFGSSSASTVCVVKGLAELFDIKLSSKEIFDLAYKTVLDIQGKGSGFDVAAAVYGGTLYFVTGGDVIESVEVDTVPLVVGYSGIKADTVTLIKAVAEKASRHSDLIDSIYTDIGKVVDAARAALIAKDWALVGELMNFDEGMLESLGVGSARLSAMIYASRDAGAWGAKLSGAGVGDCMVALTPSDKRSAVADAIKKAGGETIDIDINVEGVRVEKYV